MQVCPAQINPIEAHLDPSPLVDVGQITTTRSRWEYDVAQIGGIESNDRVGTVDEPGVVEEEQDKPLSSPVQSP